MQIQNSDMHHGKYEVPSRSANEAPKIPNRRKGSISALIEGKDNNGWYCHKLARLDIPEDAAFLYDGRYRHSLYGHSDDFYLMKIVRPSQGLEFTLKESLASCPGKMIKGTRIPDPARVLVLSDGRMFYGEGVVLNVNELAGLLANAKGALVNRHARASSANRAFPLFSKDF